MVGGGVRILRVQPPPPAATLTVTFCVICWLAIHVVIGDKFVPFESVMLHVHNAPFSGRIKIFTLHPPQQLYARCAHVAFVPRGFVLQLEDQVCGGGRQSLLQSTKE